MTRLPELPQEFLHSILIYDAKSGLLCGLWHARTQIGGKIISARYFRTREEAIEARAKLVAEHHGEFAVADLERQGYDPVH